MTTAPPRDLQGVLDERQLTKMLGVSVATIRRWRLLRRGPAFLKFFGCVRYDPRDVAVWLASTRRASELEAQ